MLREKFGQVPDLPAPSGEASFSYALPFSPEKDLYLTSVERMFANSPNPEKPSFRSAPLDSKVYRYVVLGHTHEDLQESVGTVANATYFNTGSWISRIDSAGDPVFRRRYLSILQDAGGRMTDRFGLFPD